MVDVLARAPERGPHRQLVHVQVRPDERRELGWQGPDPLPLDPLRPGDAGHLDDRLGREPVQQCHPVGIRVRDVAVERERLAGLDRLHDAAAVLVARLDRHRTAELERRPHPLPLGDLPLAAHEILVERDVEVLDQIGPAVLDEPGAVLGEVLGRLGREVAEVVEHS